MRSSKKIAELESKIAVLETCLHTLNSQMIDMQAEMNNMHSTIVSLTESLKAKQDIISEQEKEIRRWNEGISNIMNYSLEVAKGGNRP